MSNGNRNNKPVVQHKSGKKVNLTREEMLARLKAEQAGETPKPAEVVEQKQPAPVVAEPAPQVAETTPQNDAAEAEREAKRAAAEAERARLKAASSGQKIEKPAKTEVAPTETKQPASVKLSLLRKPKPSSLHLLSQK
ncbi:hypothetical protein [Kingella kingae]|uniref:hypothetical protein n=1 Tax=Kingella kingae TaxID=504 RepID=UPI0003F9507C